MRVIQEARESLRKSECSQQLLRLVRSKHHLAHVSSMISYVQLMKLQYMLISSGKCTFIARATELRNAAGAENFIACNAHG